MRQTKLTILLIFIFTVVGCTDNDTKSAISQATTDESSFSHSMSIADSLYSNMNFRDAYDLYQQLLDHEEVKSDNEKRLSVLNALGMTSQLSGHKAEENKWLQQLLDLSKQTGNDYYHSMALMSMGQNVFYEGNHELGIHYVNEAISLMSKTNRADADHLMHGYLIMLARLYGEVKDYDNALKVNERNLQLTMHGTRWGNVQNQQLIDRRMALAKIAALLAKMGRLAPNHQQSHYFQRADSAYAAWKAVQYEGNHTRDYFIVDYMKQRGRYNEAIPIYNVLIERVRQQGDTLSEMMNTAKWGLAEVYRKMGNCEQAAILYEQVLEIQDTLKSRKAKNTAQELAAIYHDQEQDQIIMQKEAENARQKYLLISVVIILLAMAVFASIVTLQNTAIHRKNRALAQQISDALKYKEISRRALNQQPLQNPLSQEAVHTQHEEAAKPTSVPHQEVQDLTLLSDEQLFHYIDDIVIHEHLFINPNFGREQVMERFHLTKERVGAAFSKGCLQHAKMSNYIQQLRLEYAAQLLLESPDKNMQQIATESGFGSSAYFSNCFRQHFGISPSDYRRNATEH